MYTNKRVITDKTVAVLCLYAFRMFEWRNCNCYHWPLLLLVFYLTVLFLRATPAIDTCSIRNVIYDIIIIYLLKTKKREENAFL